MKKKSRKIFIDIIFLGQFAIDDFRAKYVGSTLGAAWAFLQPISTIIVYWFVFQLGFNSEPIKGFPFILWLVIGLVPWFFISDAISNATLSIVEYSYLVKKVLFNINILPLTKILSVFFVQIVLIVFTVGIYGLFGYYPDIYYIQIPIYLIYMMILTSGIIYLTATLYVFFKDTIQIVSIILQIMFWLTPIVWDFEIMPECVKKVLMFNPFYYVINGYRNIFIYKQSLEKGLGMIVYYWIVAFILLFLGLGLFVKCKDYFADVL